MSKIRSTNKPPRKYDILQAMVKSQFMKERNWQAMKFRAWSLFQQGRKREKLGQRYIKKSEAMNQQHSKLRLYICLQRACSQKFEDNVIWNSPPVREKLKIF